VPLQIHTVCCAGTKRNYNMPTDMRQSLHCAGTHENDVVAGDDIGLIITIRTEAIQQCNVQITFVVWDRLRRRCGLWLRICTVYNNGIKTRSHVADIKTRLSAKTYNDSFF